MTYKLTGYEKIRDDKGDVVSIYVTVLVANDTDSYLQEYYLTDDERVIVLGDETKLTSILEKVGAHGEIKLEELTINQSQEAIYADKEKLDEFVISKEKVKAEKEKLKII